ncbi:hypothetical protein [Haloarchaeobius sp. DFWS5]|uniref:hypothetical protein n=1 Tax=Haloarchaeobius sp. DFWS5 TaxID=3446114 RepID=UPI003EC0D18E
MREDDSFEPALLRALQYPARVAILATLVEHRDESLGATTITAEAGLAASTFHSHRETLLDLELVEKHEGDGYPSYSLADTEQARLLADLDEALQRAYERRDDFVTSVEEFVE